MPQGVLARTNAAMQLDIVDNNAAERLLSFLARQKNDVVSWSAVHLPRAALLPSTKRTDILKAIRPAVMGWAAGIYFFHDGDVAILWSGPAYRTRDAILEGLDGILDGTMRDRCVNYDLRGDNAAVRTLCERKIGNRAGQQITAFKAAARDRKKRQTPEILIVEDQVFSSRLLRAFLDRNYNTCVAPDAEAALEIYLRTAPDIVFLDIELPGVNGDEFVGMVTKLDPESYVVMVSANASLDNINRCMRNGAKNFIVKPYSKQKISQSIAKYTDVHQRAL